MNTSSTPSYTESNEKPVDEKQAVDTSPAPSLETGEVGFGPEETKKLLRKLDWNLVPFLALLYLYVIL